MKLYVFMCSLLSLEWLRDACKDIDDYSADDEGGDGNYKDDSSCFAAGWSL